MAYSVWCGFTCKVFNFIMAMVAKIRKNKEKNMIQRGSYNQRYKEKNEKRIKEGRKKERGRVRKGRKRRGKLRRKEGVGEKKVHCTQ